MTGRSLVIGIGNEYRRDDAAGLLAAQLVKAQADQKVHVCETLGDGAACVEAWKGMDLVIVIDAVRSGGHAGAVYRFDASAQSLPSMFQSCSTHSFGVSEAIELARALGQLPPRLAVYGIEGKSFEEGRGLSPEVERAAADVAERVLQELQGGAGECH